MLVNPKNKKIEISDRELEVALMSLPINKTSRTVDAFEAFDGSIHDTSEAALTYNIANGQKYLEVQNIIGSSVIAFDFSDDDIQNITKVVYANLGNFWRIYGGHSA